MGSNEREERQRVGMCGFRRLACACEVVMGQLKPHWTTTKLVINKPKIIPETQISKKDKRERRRHVKAHGKSGRVRRQRSKHMKMYRACSPHSLHTLPSSSLHAHI